MHMKTKNSTKVAKPNGYKTKLGEYKLIERAQEKFYPLKQFPNDKKFRNMHAKVSEVVPSKMVDQSSGIDKNFSYYRKMHKIYN